MIKIRDILKMISAVLFAWLYIPHIVLYALCREKRQIINEDLSEYKKRIKIGLSNGFAFLYMLHHDRYFRVIFYHRAGPVFSLLFGWWRPGDRYFVISKTTKIGKGMFCPHPYSTIINAEAIGDNFVCHHLVTIGHKNDTTRLRPIIGDNVFVGVGASIIGKVKVGNNVVIGAGSVVVKDIPNNVVVAGNPAKVVKYLGNNMELLCGL